MAAEKICPPNTYMVEAETIKVIRVISKRGCGDCCAIRNVMTWWTEDGRLIAEDDPGKE